MTAVANLLIPTKLFCRSEDDGDRVLSDIDPMNLNDPPIPIRVKLGYQGLK
jgi:hypothetical protein